MTDYLVSFQQQWVGDHAPAWFAERGRLAHAVVDDMRAAGVLVFGGGLEEDGTAVLLDPTSQGGVTTRREQVAGRPDRLGGFTVIDVPDDETAQQWATRVAAACGWPQELRRFGAGAAW